MMRVPTMHRWTPAEVYQAFARELLKANPGVVEYVEKRQKSYDKKKKLGKLIRQKRVVGGYWGKRNRHTNTPNYWIYTSIKDKKTGKEQVIEVINQGRWMAIMNAYFIKAKECIIQGETLSLGAYLGTIGIRDIERNHKNRKINFHETKKQPMVPGPDGTMRRKVIIYFTEDRYLRIAWNKAHRIPGERIYEFVPTENNKYKTGFRQMLDKANKNNPVLRLNYPFFPYIKPAS